MPHARPLIINAQERNALKVPSRYSRAHKKKMLKQKRKERERKKFCLHHKVPYLLWLVVEN